jgi:hypothetical protein
MSGRAPDDLLIRRFWVRVPGGPPSDLAFWQSMATAEGVPAATARRCLCSRRAACARLPDDCVSERDRLIRRYATSVQHRPAVAAVARRACWGHGSHPPLSVVVLVYAHALAPSVAPTHPTPRPAATRSESAYWRVVLWRSAVVHLHATLQLKLVLRFVGVRSARHLGVVAAASVAAGQDVIRSWPSRCSERLAAVSAAQRGSRV